LFCFSQAIVVDKLVEINQALIDQGLSVVSFKAVETPAGWGIEMPRISGMSVGQHIERLNPDGILTDSKAIVLQNESFEILKQIDAVTERMTGRKLTDRRQTGITSDYEDFENFIVFSVYGLLVNKFLSLGCFPF